MELKQEKEVEIRQKQKEGGTYSPRDAEIIDTKFKLDQLITVADLELKGERLTRPVSKKSFLQHVEELCTNNNLKFQEEFSELPKFLQDLSSTDADLPWNRAKNRFPNIKPYNNNRVKLIADASIPGSDYINASYVSGYLCPNEFIATQGPLPGTVGDFWRMVWETRAKTLVMLTQCFEKGRIRCHQYWPEDNKPVTVFGDIVITKLMEDVQIDWTIRDLKIERHGDCMTVRQCNFTAWPEHGVPENSAPLVHFVKLVRASRAHDTTPMIVHCRHSISFYTSAFWISYRVKEVTSPSVLLTIQHFRRWTLWMPWKVMLSLNGKKRPCKYPDQTLQLKIFSNPRGQNFPLALLN